MPWLTAGRDTPPIAGEGSALTIGALQVEASASAVLWLTAGWGPPLWAEALVAVDAGSFLTIGSWSMVVAAAPYGRLARYEDRSISGRWR